MKALGRWMSPLGLAACLALAGCTKQGEPSGQPAASPRPEADAPAQARPSAQAEPSPAPDASTPTPAQGQPDAQPGSAGGQEWTAGIVDVQRRDLRPVTLRGVRTGRQEGFDRIVFEFDGDQLPGYHLEYVDKPVRKCGSGDPAEVAGDAWLEIRLMPAQAHVDGQVTVAERERQLSLPVLAELELTCDFEADVTWALGVKHPNKYRVMALSGPTRLVVDVQH